MRAARENADTQAVYPSPGKEGEGWGWWGRHDAGGERLLSSRVTWAWSGRGVRTVTLPWAATRDFRSVCSQRLAAGRGASLDGRRGREVLARPLSKRFVSDGRKGVLGRDVTHTALSRSVSLAGRAWACSGGVPAPLTPPPPWPARTACRPCRSGTRRRSSSCRGCPCGRPCTSRRRARPS